MKKKPRKKTQKARVLVSRPSDRRRDPSEPATAYGRSIATFVTRIKQQISGVKW